MIFEVHVRYVILLLQLYGTLLFVLMTGMCVPFAGPRFGRGPSMPLAFLSPSGNPKAVTARGGAPTDPLNTRILYPPFYWPLEPEFEMRVFMWSFEPLN